MQNVANKSRSPAKSDIETPAELCRFITDMVLSVIKPTVILDPCSGNGNLTQYFEDVEVIDYEIKKGRNFLDSVRIDCDLVVCNPPFNNETKGSKQLLPEVFLKHILKVLHDKNTPIVLIVPHGFRHNVRKKSKRLEFLTTLNISSIISLPLDVFEGVLFHTEILVLNMPRLSKSHLAYHPNTTFKNSPTHLKSLSDTLNKCVGVENKAFLSICRTLAFSHGLQQSAGHLLAALIYYVDRNGYININSTVRDELANTLNSSEQSITNQLKALADDEFMNNIIRELFLSRWVGKHVLSSTKNMREQLHKNLTDQVSGYWSGHTAYHLMVDGGFLLDGDKSSNKKLTPLGDLFIKSCTEAKEGVK